ncbi:hypothetical protein SBA5_760024 [Candidatus Sulfotelmatomonas gaucii]|uniref:Uncharacterized protein n=1 Tax=Candidatus Sulfuritelmatomonas gaucii TaxID=2043161 RepID=A0A2N9M3Z8_9BACT|nr:hypothetical protein SBA5_760024 [Candidatus Sulfotelmatomonas gaucii]
MRVSCAPTTGKALSDGSQTLSLAFTPPDSHFHAVSLNLESAVPESAVDAHSGFSHRRQMDPSTQANTVIGISIL